jgi:hypothetical protein
VNEYGHGASGLGTLPFEPVDAHLLETTDRKSKAPRDTLGEDEEEDKESAKIAKLRGQLDDKDKVIAGLQEDLKQSAVKKTGQCTRPVCVERTKKLAQNSEASSKLAELDKHTKVHEASAAALAKRPCCRLECVDNARDAKRSRVELSTAEQDATRASGVQARADASKIAQLERELQADKAQLAGMQIVRDDLRVALVASQQECLKRVVVGQFNTETLSGIASAFAQFLPGARPVPPPIDVPGAMVQFRSPG